MRLRRVDCAEPGINRVRRGRGFSYREEDGTSVRNRETLERIRELTIPPAWKDVWICLHPRGHLQATGLDAAGRKQYLYHERWREHRDREKFERMLEFARALPKLRRRLDSDLARQGLIRERVLACAVRLLDLGFFRVGSEQYRDENETYGLTTLRRSHVTLKRGAAVFDYTAKGDERTVQTVADPTIRRVIAALKRRRGSRQLLVYREGREWRDVRAEDINDYLKEAAGGEFSAKDFRTWNATVLAAVSVASHEHNDRPESRTARKRLATRAVKQVAGYLANTPAVCRSSYIDPRVFDRFDSGITVAKQIARVEADTGPTEFPDRERIEAAVIKLIS